MSLLAGFPSGMRNANLNSVLKLGLFHENSTFLKKTLKIGEFLRDSFLSKFDKFDKSISKSIIFLRFP